MKSNQYYKNEALSALRGNWANALVATIIFIALALFFSSNDAINSYLSARCHKSVHRLFAFIRFAVRAAASGGGLFKQHEGIARDRRQQADQQLVQPRFRKLAARGLGNGSEHHIHLLVDIAADYPGNHQVIFLRAYAVYSRRASGNVCQ